MSTVASGEYETSRSHLSHFTNSKTRTDFSSPAIMTVVEEYDENQMGDDGGATGPGAPTPLSALEVSCPHQSMSFQILRRR
jgi:hypothetical protein